jgi:hypothetical protein
MSGKGQMIARSPSTEDVITQKAKIILALAIFSYEAPSSLALNFDHHSSMGRTFKCAFDQNY